MTGNNIDPDRNRAIVDAIVGGPASHIPVMLNEVLHALQPARGKFFIDGTFGAGGYAGAILDTGAHLLAIDRDPDAKIAAKVFSNKYGEKFQFITGEFARMDIHCRDAAIEAVDGVVFDIGVSSMQLDEAERGFSFMRDGPLDMRMGQSGISASDVVNRADGRDLTRIIGILGEERHAGRVSRAIVARREEKPILRTLDLAQLVEKTLGRKFSDRIHPATRTFQALRIFVNRELQQLANGLFAAERILTAGGRLVVVTFHSLEDRIVKQFFADRVGGKSRSRHLPPTDEPAACFSQLKRSALKASEEEARKNPRARSAKLRWATRTQAGARDENLNLFGREVALTLSRSIE